MELSWVLICFIWATQGPLSHADTCQSLNCTINLMIGQPLPMPPRPLPCSRGCMTLRCTACGSTQDKERLIYYYKYKQSCYPERRQHLDQGMHCCQRKDMPQQNMHCCQRKDMPQQNMHCCQRKDMPQQNMHCCQRKDMPQHCDLAIPDDKSQDSKSGPGEIGSVISGVIGSLIVLMLIAIFAVLLINIIRKRRRGHALQGEGRGYHNRDIENTTYIHSAPLPSGPSPYVSAARTEPHGHVYAQLEGDPSFSDYNHYTTLHLYEEADKYCRHGIDEGCAYVRGQRVKPEFQCIITPPPEDEYVDPNDAIPNKGVTVAQSQTNIQEIVEEPQTKEHDYAVLEQDTSSLKGSETASVHKEMEGKVKYVEIESHDGSGQANKNNPPDENNGVSTAE